MPGLSNAPLFQTLRAVSLQAGILALVAWVACLLLKNAPARFRCALWLIVLIKFLSPPLPYLPSQTLLGNHVVSTVGSVATAETIEPGNGRPGPIGLIVPLLIILGSVVLPLAWIVAMLLSVVLLLLRQTGQWRLIKGCSAAGEEFHGLLRDTADKIGVKKLPRLLVSDLAFTPMLVGLFKPTIILPSLVTSCGATHLRAMLLHELAHVKRRDMVALWVQHLVQGFFLFHPATWLAGRQLKRERERACDELVLSLSAIAPKDYAAGYVQALKAAASQSPVPMILGMAEPLETEKSRVESILRYHPTGISALPILIIAAVVILGLPSFARIEGNVPHSIIETLRSQADQPLEVDYSSKWMELSQSAVLKETLSNCRYRRGHGGAFLEDVELDSTEARRHGTTLAAGPGTSLSAAEHPFYEGRLYERLRFGRISNHAVKIDGHPCIEVEVPSDWPVITRYLVWLDPGIAFNPRRIDLIWRDKTATNMRYEDYHQIAPGVWFPGRETVDYTSRFKAGERFRVVNTVRRLKIDP